MILSTKHKFMFWHVPKTAGMSVRDRLDPLGISLRQLFGHHWENRYSAKNWFHINQDDFRREIEPTGLQVAHYKEFAFVRNPYEVMVSKYNYAKIPTVDLFNRPMPYPMANVSFDEFLNKQITRLDGSWMAFPQAHWTENPVTRTGVQIFKVENLPRSWQDLQDYIGVKLDPLGKNNVSLPKLMTVDQLSDAQRDLIYNHYLSDFETFGYER